MYFKWSQIGNFVCNSSNHSEFKNKTYIKYTLEYNQEYVKVANMDNSPF